MAGGKVSIAPGSEGTWPTCGLCVEDPAEYNIGLFIKSFVNRLKIVKILLPFRESKKRSLKTLVLCHLM